ncbi:ribosomal protection-like ABC-F family protein [Paenibacillus silvae]|uniref:ribosomal protection-like ABC-F family protein n=1 Tax=Paenibacillus silvae TaxID=1325358 RepID=UPI00119F0A4A|nr:MULTISPECIES: ABC-F family ATP-binding cassette domain-containing protein [Paenibacillus]MCK6075969.1 ATP-binding cassette domain-containing protein [Paenibacillus silvae]MCK6150358.1 ATP-binding cassette domain-containing protein [Paenibacillus silvae]MCK6268656.1 ATP-binding cassette domain-containing protein [Paenibacillus silvae]
MMIISAQQLKQYHGAHLVLDGITFEIMEGDKVALIGRNGSGKTTLMRLMARLSQPDEGQLMLKKDTRVGYVAQVPEGLDDHTVLDVLGLGFQELIACRTQMKELEQQMSDPTCAADQEQLERLLKRYAALQERFEREGGYEMDARIDQVADGLDIAKTHYSWRFGSLSGGEQTRVVLASQLIVSPDLLLLDEPTNHLDLERVEWLEGFLREYNGTVVLISHDRYFLDRVVTRTLELEDGEAETAAGGYTEYMKVKEQRLLKQFEEFKEQQKVIKKMKETIRQLEEWGRVGGNEKFFRRAASMRKALERMEQVKRPVLERRHADFDVRPTDRTGKRVAVLEDVEKRYGDRVILRGVSALLEYGDKTALIGRNGSGKTTLFRLLLGEEHPDAGGLEWGARVDVGYLAQQEEPLNPKLSVLEHFRLEAGVEEGEARGILARYLFYGADVFRSVGQLSGGEWTRLRLALLVQRKPNVLLLDEPTNHLDIASREALEDSLADFEGTVLAISHDRYFVNRLASRVWELEEGQLTTYLGDYEAYREKKLELQNRVAKDISRDRGASEVGNGSKTGRRTKGTDVSRTAQESEPKAGGFGRGNVYAGEETALGQFQVHAEHDAGQVKTDQGNDNGSSSRSGSRNRDSSRNGQQGSVQKLEQAMARIEVQIQELDRQLEALANDSAALEQTWNEREQLSAAYDELLAQWAEM